VGLHGYTASSSAFEGQRGLSVRAEERAGDPPRELSNSGAMTEMTDVCRIVTMQTTLRIDDATYREAKAEAARLGMTLTRFIEESLRQRIVGGRVGAADRRKEIEERDRLMESLLRRTARFRVGRKPTREETNERK
jgi:hypothetical protein